MRVQSLTSAAGRNGLPHASAVKAAAHTMSHWPSAGPVSSIPPIRIAFVVGASGDIIAFSATVHPMTQQQVSDPRISRRIICRLSGYSMPAVWHARMTVCIDAHMVYFVSSSSSSALLCLKTLETGAILNVSTMLTVQCWAVVQPLYLAQEMKIGDGFSSPTKRRSGGAAVSAPAASVAPSPPAASAGGRFCSGSTGAATASVLAGGAQAQARAPADLQAMFAPLLANGVSATSATPKQQVRSLTTVLLVGCLCTTLPAAVNLRQHGCLTKPSE